MKCHDVRPEHILLGLAEAKDGIAAQVLTRFGVKAEEIRAELAHDYDWPEDP